jgi:hypothetical protein
VAYLAVDEEQVELVVQCVVIPFVSGVVELGKGLPEGGDHDGKETDSDDEDEDT